MVWSINPHGSQTGNSCVQTPRVLYLLHFATAGVFFLIYLGLAFTLWIKDMFITRRPSVLICSS